MSILVFIEQRDGAIRPVCREVLGEASRLATSLSGRVVGVCAAAADPGLAGLGDAGASEILLATHDAFRFYEPSGMVKAVVAAVEKVAPKAVLFAASSMGRDLAPRVAARLGVGLASDCTALAVEGGRLVATRPVYAGKAIQKVAFPKTPAIASLRPKVFAPVSNAGAAGAVAIAAVSDPAPNRMRLLRTARPIPIRTWSAAARHRRFTRRHARRSRGAPELDRMSPCP